MIGLITEILHPHVFVVEEIKGLIVKSANFKAKIIDTVWFRVIIDLFLIIYIIGRREKVLKLGWESEVSYFSKSSNNKMLFVKRGYYI